MRCARYVFVQVRTESIEGTRVYKEIKTRLTIYSIDEAGRYRDSGGDRFSVKFYDPNTNTNANSTIVDLKNGKINCYYIGTYVVTFMTNRCGNYSLDISLIDRDNKGRLLKGSL